MIIDIRKYTLSDQNHFAEFSGDFNPVHIDKIKARREYHGEVVVHGIHCTLNALDAYLKTVKERGITSVVIKKLNIYFQNPIFLNQRTETQLIEESNNCANIQIHSKEQLVTEIRLEWENIRKTIDSNLPAIPTNRQRLTPLTLDIHDIQGRNGILDLYIDKNFATEKFPNIATLIPLHTFAEFLALTRLVGMECPGLYSIFSSIDIECDFSTEIKNILTYKVKETNPRYMNAVIAVKGPTISGTINTFFRPAPQKQARITDIQKIVTPTEFENQCALIIGGSRGIGEVTAKIIAAGGGYSIIGYYRCREDAERIYGEINSINKNCEILQFNILNPQKALSKLAKKNITPSHIYYFATPKIFINKGKEYNKGIFDVFSVFYIDGLYKTYQAYRSYWSDKISIFFPSSIALDEKVGSLIEYSIAKAAGEKLCDYLNHFDSNLSVFVKRLPRIATDQTLSLFNQPAANALDIMVDIVREINDSKSEIHK